MRITVGVEFIKKDIFVEFAKTRKKNRKSSETKTNCLEICFENVTEKMHF